MKCFGIEVQLKNEPRLNGVEKCVKIIQSFIILTLTYIYKFIYLYNIFYPVLISIVSESDNCIVWNEHSLQYVADPVYPGAALHCIIDSLI